MPSPFRRRIGCAASGRCVRSTSVKPAASALTAGRSVATIQAVLPMYERAGFEHSPELLWSVTDGP